jgi:hypothetical protein
MSVFFTEREFTALVEAIREINMRYIQRGLIPVYRYWISTTSADVRTATSTCEVDMFVKITPDGKVIIFKYELQPLNGLVEEEVPSRESERILEMVKMTVADLLELIVIKREFELYKDLHTI